MFFRISTLFLLLSSGVSSASPASNQVLKALQEKNILPSSIRLESGEYIFLEYRPDGKQFCYSGSNRVVASGYIDAKTNKIIIDQNVNPSRCPSMD